MMIMFVKKTVVLVTILLLQIANVVISSEIFTSTTPFWGLFCCFLFTATCAILLFNQVIKRALPHTAVVFGMVFIKLVLFIGCVAYMSETSSFLEPFAPVLLVLLFFCLISGWSLLGVALKKPKKVRRKLDAYSCIATFLVGTFFISAILMGGGAGFFNIPSMIITFGVALALLMGNYGKSLFDFIPDAFMTLFSKPLKPNFLYAEIAKQGSRYIIGCGVLGTLIGLIQMLKNLEDPSTIGAGMAVALLTSLYAIFASEVVFAFLYRAYSRPVGDDQLLVEKDVKNVPSTLPLKNIGIPVILLAWILISFFVCLIGFSNINADYIQENWLLRSQLIDHHITPIF